MTQKFSYSVVIPSSVRPTLLKAIGSCFKQAVPPTEVVVVTNTKTKVNFDSTYGHRVRIIETNPGNEVKSYAAHNRNVGVNSVTTDLVAFLDDDDYWFPQKMFVQMEYMWSHNLDVVASGCLYRLDKFRLKKFRPRRLYSSDAGDIFEYFYGSIGLIGKGYLPTPSVVVRTAVAKAEPFVEDLDYYEDVDWLQRLYEKGYRMTQVGDSLLEVSASPTRSMARQNFEMNFRWIQKLEKKDVKFARNFIIGVCLRSSILKLKFVDTVRYLRLLTSYL